MGLSLIAKNHNGKTISQIRKLARESGVEKFTAYTIDTNLFDDKQWTIDETLDTHKAMFVNLDDAKGYMKDYLETNKNNQKLVHPKIMAEYDDNEVFGLEVNEARLWTDCLDEYDDASSIDDFDNVTAFIIRYQPDGTPVVEEN